MLMVLKTLGNEAYPSTVCDKTSLYVSSSQHGIKCRMTEVSFSCTAREQVRPLTISPTLIGLMVVCEQNDKYYDVKLEKNWHN